VTVIPDVNGSPDKKSSAFADQVNAYDAKAVLVVVGDAVVVVTPDAADANAALVVAGDAEVAVTPDAAVVGAAEPLAALPNVNGTSILVFPSTVATNT
jgi:hypothetical protein